MRIMEFRQIAEVMKDSEEGGLAEKKNTLFSNLNSDQKQLHIDSASALQQYLDPIPISSIPGIKNSLVLELKAGDSVKDAIRMLYENMFCAPIADVLDPNTANIRFSNRYIGFIDFASMVLWCLEEYENIRKNSKDNGLQLQATENNGLFSVLDQIPQIGQTKLQVLPVIEQSNPQLIGFVTQSTVVQLLLQSTGLAWFDSMADKAPSDFRYSSLKTNSILLLYLETKLLLMHYICNYRSRNQEAHWHCEEQ